MDTLYGITEADATILKQIAQHWRSTRRNVDNRRGPELDESQTSDIYIALTPNTGIPALTQTGTSTGTLFGDGSGDIPGKGDCEIYEILEPAVAGEHYTLSPITSYTQTVFNLAHEAIGASRWVIVVRDKFGSWLATGSGGGGGGSVVYSFVKPVEVGTATGTGTVAPVSGQVYSCQYASPVINSPAFILGDLVWAFFFAAINGAEPDILHYYYAIPNGHYSIAGDSRELYFALGPWAYAVDCNPLSRGIETTLY